MNPSLKVTYDDKNKDEIEKNLKSPAGTLYRPGFRYPALEDCFPLFGFYSALARIDTQETA